MKKMVIVSKSMHQHYPTWKPYLLKEHRFSNVVFCDEKDDDDEKLPETKIDQADVYLVARINTQTFFTQHPSAIVSSIPEIYRLVMKSNLAELVKFEIFKPLTFVDEVPSCNQDQLVGVWLEKPRHDSCGNNICILQDLQNKGWRKPGYILQQHVQHPYLHQNKYKCDFRVLVCARNDRKFFIFDDALLRASTQKFDMNSLDKMVHLTNISVQQEYDLKVKNNSLLSLVSPASTQQVMKTEIFMIVERTLELFWMQVKAYEPKHKRFRILGFDIMFDTMLKGWLLEVNSWPVFTQNTNEMQDFYRRAAPALLKFGIFHW
jgi:hypothetical protein